MALLSKPELVKLAVQVASEFSLDPALVCAHCDVRSHWDSGLSIPSGANYHPTSLTPLEVEHRSILWGLMAISGEFARNQGFAGSLPELLVPSANLREGCRILLSTAKTKGLTVGLPDSLLRWNNSPDRELVALTLQKVAGYRELLQRIDAQQSTFPDADKTLLQVHSQIAGNRLE